MKKILVALLGVTLLVGCSDEVVKDKEAENIPVVKEENEALNDFPEYDLLAQHIDLSAYEAHIETDNKGTRVIFFEDEEGQKAYKSIFVKEANHLKLISLNDDGLIYNDVIK